MSARALKAKMVQRIPLYLAGYGVGCTGLAGLAMQTQDNYAVLIMSAQLLYGFALSWFTRAGVFRKKNRSDSGIPPLWLWIPAFYSLSYVLLPWKQSEGYPEGSSLMVFLAGIMIVCSHLFYSDAAVPMVCVPSVSLISLATFSGHQWSALPLFGIFLILSSYVLIQENALVSRASETNPRGERRVLPVKRRWGSLLAVGIALMAIASGVVLGRALDSIFTFPFHLQLSHSSAEPTPQVAMPDDYVPVSTGPVSLSEREVMIVQCDEPLLWRGQTFDMYTEDGWRNGLPSSEQRLVRPERYERVRLPESSRPLPISAAHRYDLSGGERGEAKAARRVVQTYRQTAYGRSNIVYAAAEPQTVIMPVRSPLIKAGGTLKTQEHYAWGLAYEVESIVSDPTEEELRAAGTDYPAEITGRYLRVPQSSWQVGELVKEITKGKATPLDKALAIQRYLEQHFTYDTNVPAAPRGSDVVTHFLFKSKRGYCDIFASSMVIMSRQAGIPARWVTGYTTGEYDPADNAYHVRERNAHAWAELYFPGYGWIAFDATPSSEPPALASRVKSLIGNTSRALLDNKPFFLAVVIILALLLYLVKAEVSDRIRAGRSESRLGTLGTGVIGHYHWMCNLLARYGYPRMPWVTPLEYAADLRQRVGPELGGIASLVESITEAFVDRKYAMCPPSAEKDTEVGCEIRRLAKRLKTARRRRLLPR